MTSSPSKGGDSRTRAQADQAMGACCSLSRGDGYDLAGKSDEDDSWASQEESPPPQYSSREIIPVQDILLRRSRVGGELRCYACRRCLEDEGVLALMDRFETAGGDPVPKPFSHTSTGIFCKVGSCEVHDEGLLIARNFTVTVK
jgi:hypothetical protein